MAKFQIFFDVQVWVFVYDGDGSMNKQFSAAKIKQLALKRQQQIFQGHHRYNSIQLLKLLLIRKSFSPTRDENTRVFVFVRVQEFGVLIIKI